LRSFSIPLPAAEVIAKLAGAIANVPIDQQTVQMLARGNHSSADEFVQQFQFSPRSVEFSLEQSPAQASDKLHASTFFLPKLLLASLALVWIATGLCSLGLYPVDQSLKLLSDAGISDSSAKFLLYGGGMLDLLLGLAMFSRQLLPRVLQLQLVSMLLYTGIICLQLPELWLHPFGPVTKNLPMAVATLYLLAITRREKWNI